MTLSADTEEAYRAVMARFAVERRMLVAVSGPPGSGKSTLAEGLVAQLTDNGINTALVPMDGFHLDDRILNARGHRARKGAPHTFDADGFVALVERLARPGTEVFHPVFDRSLEMAIAGAGVVAPATQIIVIEGNYLLLDEAPWRNLKPLFDFTIFLSPGMETLHKRLMERWLGFGFNEQDALAKAEGNDLPNARLVVEKSWTADLLLGQD